MKTKTKIIVLSLAILLGAFIGIFAIEFVFVILGENMPYELAIGLGSVLFGMFSNMVGLYLFGGFEE